MSISFRLVLHGSIQEPSAMVCHGETPVEEYGLPPPGRLFDRTLTAQRSRHLRVTCARSACVLPLNIFNLLPHPTAFSLYQ